MAKCFVDDTSLTSIAEAIRTKGGTTDQLVFPAGFISAIEAIEAGGGTGIEIPTGYKISTGSYTPNTEGTNITHIIKIASSLPYSLPCMMFCIYREEGFNATGSDANRYLTFFVGAISSRSTSSGAYLYRNYAASSDFAADAGTESANTVNCGLPSTASKLRSNCFVRLIETNGKLTFSTYGIVTLESGKTYKWFALLPSTAEV